MEDCCESNHPDYSKLIPRINRAIGQLGGIKKMIEERRYCPEIIMQLRAVGSACQSIETTMLQKHLESCVTQAFQSNDSNSQKEKIRELTNLYKRKSATYVSSEIHE
ncbi:MAG: metal-sensitive transcriptional regulator [Porticoccus sp.]|jgi:DNA-binding FrmR family transcriptional regulator